jgi:hypothetical protein
MGGHPFARDIYELHCLSSKETKLFFCICRKRDRAQYYTMPRK